MVECIRTRREQQGFAAGSGRGFLSGECFQPLLCSTRPRQSRRWLAFCIAALFSALPWLACQRAPLCILLLVDWFDQVDPVHMRRCCCFNNTARQATLLWPFPHVPWGTPDWDAYRAEVYKAGDELGDDRCTVRRQPMLILGRTHGANGVAGLPGPQVGIYARRPQQRQPQPPGSTLTMMWWAPAKIVGECTSGPGASAGEVAKRPTRVCCILGARRVGQRRTQAQRHWQWVREMVRDQLACTAQRPAATGGGGGVAITHRRP